MASCFVLDDVLVETDPPSTQSCEEKRYGERREVVLDALARLPTVLISCLVPAGNTADNYAAWVLGDILGTGQSSGTVEVTAVILKKTEVLAFADIL